MISTLSLIQALFRFLGLAIVAWVFIHLMALFGPFVALAYPVVWLVAPNAIPDLLHQATGTGHPRSIFSAVRNGAVLLVFSIVSAGLVYIESRLLFDFGFPQSSKTAYFAIPPRSQYRVNERIPLEIKISGYTTPINAVQADVAFDPSVLQLVDIDIENSFATIFVQREIDNNAGFFRLNGGLPNPGFSGAEGLFATAYFQAIQPGVTKIEFLPTSLILANDSYGTNILRSLSSTSYFILPAEPSGQFSTPTIGESQVLGATTDKEVYFDYFPQVLGTDVGDELSTQVSEKSTESLTFMLWLESFNRVVLRFWSTIGSGIQSLLHLG